ncbi:MAG: alcohol dehydrogenase [Deltaproteobacteria bacterium]|nr:alcohol dehydrogenase [Deltaproteobacteria bacterium]
MNFTNDPATPINKFYPRFFLKAVQFHQHGGVDQLRYEERADPELQFAGDVIVKLKAAALNHIDIWIRRGLTGIEVPFPHILGGDGAGVVVAIGSEVKNLKLNDAVCLYPPSGCGQCEFCVTDREWMCVRIRVLGEREHGTYAEYVRVPARNCFPIPAGLSFTEAAAFPLVFITVWHMLVTNAQVKAGESILILGIGGGVATAALQLAAAIGMHSIVTSSSAAKLEQAQKLGAAHGINYREADFAKEVRNLTAKRGVDVVVDCVGGESWVKSLASLAKGGRLVTCGATAGATPQTDLRRIFWNDLKIFGSTLGTREEFRQVREFISQSRTKPVIDKLYKLQDAAEAQARLEAGQQFGKIILTMDD